MSKIPVTVITGFLGAGKTTLIRHLLGHAKGKRIALIINEFGDLGVDKEVLAAGGHEACREEDMIELANGCICCRVTIDGVVTVADAAALSEGRFAADEQAVAKQRAADAMLDHATPLGELFKDQLVAADLVVVNKTDLVDDAAITRVEKMLRAEMREGTGLIRARGGYVDIAALLGLGLATEDNLSGRDSAHELEHGGEGHEHDDFDSFSVKLRAGISREALLGAIESAIRSHDVLRLKGFAALPGSDARLAIQAVGPRINAWFDRPWKQGEARETALVVIGEGPLDRDAITATLTKAAERAAA
jgi:cobalamin biosynthesis protein CobW